jgi:4-phospho-D-threonate 3-dehydrogenase / 4-phospho-D-erythronate 3-dehydrogenase
LIDAIAKIEQGLVERTIAHAHASLAQGTKILESAFCTINPHAGEHGLSGYALLETEF